MTAADYWNVGAAHRACELCEHGRSGACSRHEVRGRGFAVPFPAARAKGGPCGPEAAFLTIKGLDYSKGDTWKSQSVLPYSTPLSTELA